MYETFFGLKQRPFLFVPDVESYFSVEFMEESRYTVERTVQNGGGISLIFGATGTGKTLLLKVLRQSLESEYTVAFVSHCRLETPQVLFLQLAHDLHFALSGSEAVELRLQLLDFARQEPTKGVVLLFDDAQYLSPSVLEEIRLLTDSIDGSVPLFRVVLAGTVNFEEKLTLPDLEAFNQRVVSRCYLDSFSSEETSRYLVRQTDDLRIDPPHTTSSLFTDEAKRRIHQLTGGVPRLINQLCGTTLQFAAERGKQNVDGALINDAWANLQHIEPFTLTAETNCLIVQRPMISPEQIEKIVDRKRKTFQVRQLPSVEFGTLSDADSESRPVHGNEYKPPFPEDDEEEETVADCLADTPVLPAVTAKIYVPDPEPTIPDVRAVVRRWRKLVPNFNKQRRKFQRRYLLYKIQHRLGLFACLLRKTDIQQTAYVINSTHNESAMNAKTLQEYGAAVLEGRPPFVRKEPLYAYQTTEPALRRDVTYPDPTTGVPIMLRWLPEGTCGSDRFGVSYTDYLETATKTADSRRQTTADNLAGTPVIVRTSLNASHSGQVSLLHCQGLDETFDESRRVSGSAVSLAELFRVNTSALQQTCESAEFKNLDDVVQRQLESVVKRLTKAAEKIEQAADVSEQAGRHVSSAAKFVEAEVQSALPTYSELFRKLSEFQEMVSAELDAARQQSAETLKFQTFAQSGLAQSGLPRRQVMIERAVPKIDVEMLLR
jgi:type II secretory pathway predicted ATPase ExeA